MIELEGKKVLVLGLGKSGVAAARFCSERGARVTAADAKPESEMAAAKEQLTGRDIAFAFGSDGASLLEEADLIVASPGVPLGSPGMLSAAKRGVKIAGELELAVAEIRKPIVAITGTNGKTTTTSLTGHLLRECGIRACVAGNIGTPLLDVISEANEADHVVLEVSSFQIETAPSLSPRISVLLNATPDHLDRHDSFDEYVECKTRLVRRTQADGFGIYNAADSNVSIGVTGSRCSLIPFDATGRLPARDDERPAAWFGGGDLVVRLGSGPVARYPLSNVKLEGIHNRENMLAALTVCELCGARPHDLLSALESFTGLPHRMELIGELMGVRYYDDSKGTNVGATIRAIEAFAEPIVLIAGGISKGANFSPLAEFAQGRVKKVILIGEAAGEMEASLAGKASTLRAGTMEEAVDMAQNSADPGDVVLLSPACASFDMFRDYAHRGEIFAAAVRRIAKASNG